MTMIKKGAVSVCAALAAGAMGWGSWAQAAVKEPSEEKPRAWSLARASLSRLYYVDLNSVGREGEWTHARALARLLDGGQAEGGRSLLFTVRVGCEKRVFSAFDFSSAQGEMGEGELRRVDKRIDEKPYDENSPIWSLAGKLCEIKGDEPSAIEGRGLNAKSVK